jgi:membrane protein
MGNGAISKWKKFQEQLRAFFLEQGIERHADTRQPLLFRFAHFWLLACKSFSRNRCPVRASALAYSTLLALIPMLAVVLSISASILKSRGEEPIRVFIDRLVEQIAPYTNADLKGDGKSPEAQALAAAKRDEAVRKINEFISNTRSGAIGATGMIALVAVAISMLSRIEATFNDIWGVTHGRSWYVQIIIYWATISLGPLLLVVAIGLSSGPYFEMPKRLLLKMPFIGSLVFSILPVILLSVMFGLFYQFMPNTRVRPLAAMVGGGIAGLLWHVNNLMGVHFVSRITSNNAIYGSLGMIPVFMIGLYFAWLILLFGAQVAYAFQNRQVYLQEKQAESVNQRGREFIALRVMTQVAQEFHRGNKPPGLNQLATALGVPSRLVSHIVHALVQSGLLVEAADEKCVEESVYVPARPLDRISAHDILLALRAGQGQELNTHDDATRVLVRGEFERICEAERSVAAGVTLQKLVDEGK